VLHKENICDVIYLNLLNIKLAKKGDAMTATKTIKWTGESGNEYQYWIYKIGTAFSADPGNYVFAQDL
jgi:hypothetical protein